MCSGPKATDELFKVCLAEASKKFKPTTHFVMNGGKNGILDLITFAALLERLHAVWSKTLWPTDIWPTQNIWSTHLRSLHLVTLFRKLFYSAFVDQMSYVQMFFDQEMCNLRTGSMLFGRKQTDQQIFGQFIMKQVSWNKSSLFLKVQK
jgi:hypothetical protein